MLAIDQIAERHAKAMAHEIAETIGAEILARLNGEHEPKTSDRSAVKTPRRAAPTRKRSRILCPIRGCGKPGAGPKHQWFCAKHSTLPAKTKKQAMARRQNERW